MTRSLTELYVEVHESHDPKDIHSEITIAWAFPHVVGRDEARAADFGFPTDAQGEAAASYVAGLLARLAFAAAPWVAWSAQEHRCRSKWYGPDSEWSYDGNSSGGYDSCSIDGSDLLRPVQHWGDGVQVYLNVPTKDTKMWLGRARAWLETIADPAS